MRILKLLALGGILLAAFFTAAPVFAGGDEIVLNDGGSVKGNIVTQSEAQIYIDVPEKGLVRIDRSKIREIHFGPVPDQPAAAASLLDVSPGARNKKRSK